MLLWKYGADHITHPFFFTAQGPSFGAALRIGANMGFYTSRAWLKKRDHILRLDGYKCQYFRRFGKTVEAKIVHHIYPLKDYPQYRLADWNLISVSPAAHNKLEDRQTGELTEAGKELQRRTVPGVNWRKGRVKTIV